MPMHVTIVILNPEYSGSQIHTQSIYCLLTYPWPPNLKAPTLTIYKYLLVTSTTAYQQSLFPRTIKEWNSLPTEINSIEQFIYVL